MTLTSRSNVRRRWSGWIALAAGALVLGIAWRVFPVSRWIHVFQGWIAGLGVWGGVLYGVVYVVAALALVPGLVLTLGAGLAFGFLWGTVIVSVASTCAAALAFLIARYLARARFEAMARRNESFGAIDRAIAKNGWKVVALLRLSPLIPFSVSNYLYGLTAVDFRHYVAASWIAMLPATFLYVALGASGRTLAQGRKNPWEWALLGAGIAATLAATLLLAKVAKRELQEAREGKSENRSA